MEYLLDEYLENSKNNIIDKDLTKSIDTKFKETNLYTLVEQDDDGSYFVATYLNEETNLEALYIYTSEEEVPLGCDYMDVLFDDLKDLLNESSVKIVIINNESHNLYFEVNNLITKDTIFPLKVVE